MLGVFSNGFNYTVLLALGVFLFCIIGCIYLQASECNINICSTRKPMSAFNSYGSIVIPIACASVMPIIYASAVMMIPAMIVKYNHYTSGVMFTISKMCDLQNWFPLSTYTWGIVIYAVMLFLFGLFAIKQAFSCGQVAYRLRQNGDVILGVRPGADTVRFLNKARLRVCIISCVMLISIVTIPEILLINFLHVQLPLIGTSIVIVIAVFWDLGLCISGLSKHLSRKYDIFYL